MPDLSAAEMLQDMGVALPPQLQAQSVAHDVVQAGPVPQIPDKTGAPPPTGIAASRTGKKLTVEEDIRAGPPYVYSQSQRSIPGFEEYARAREWVESRGRAVVSPKGAQGPAQVLPSTARAVVGGALPDDWNKGDTNRAIGNKYLEDQYNKYGNWPDALAAYNAGPGRVDKWIEAGRPETGKGALPAETRAYVRQVADIVGGGEMPPSAGATVGKKRSLSAEDMLQDMRESNEVTPETSIKPKTATGIDPLSGMEVTVPTEDTPKDNMLRTVVEASEAAVTGIRRGAQSLVTGPLQLGLELTNPEMARQLTNAINNLEAPFEPAVRKHPYLATSGEIVGSVASMMAGAGLIGAIGKGAGALGVHTPELVTRMLDVVPNFVKGTAQGAALSGTQYNPNPEGASRWEEAVVGGAFGGVIGATFARSVGRATRQSADRNAQQAAIQAVQEEAKRVGESIKAARDDFLGHYTHVDFIKNTKYGFRNVAGQGIEEGFSYEPMREAVERAAARNPEKGVPTFINGVIADVRKDLGIAAQEAKRKEAEQAAKEYGEQFGNVARQHEQMLDDMASRHYPGWDKASPEAKAALRAAVRQLPDAPKLSNVPRPPDPFLPTGIRPEQYATADKRISRALSRTKDVAVRKQLGDLKADLHRAAQADADLGGFSMQDFMRTADEADKYMREVVGPIRDWMDGRSSAQLVPNEFNPSKAKGGLTGVQFMDKVVKAVESNDPEKIPLFAKMLGERGKERLQDALLWRAAMKAENPNGTLKPGALMEYVTDNKVAIREVFGPKMSAEIEGTIKIMDRLAKEPVRRHGYLFSGSTWLGVIGLEHALRGDWLGGATLAASGWGAHMLVETGRRIHGDVIAKRIAGDAARMRPDSPELDRAINTIERRIMRSNLAVGRQTGAEFFGGNRNFPLSANQF